MCKGKISAVLKGSAWVDVALGECKILSGMFFYVLMQFLMYECPHLGLDLLATVQASEVCVVPPLLQNRHLLIFSW